MVKEGSMDDQKRKGASITPITSLRSRRPPGKLRGSIQPGWTVDEGNESAPRVDFEGNKHGPIVARFLDGCVAEADRRVLLAFEDADPLRPVVIRVLPDEPSGGNDSSGTGNILELEGKLPDAPRQLFVDGIDVPLRSDKDVELDCGESRIILRRDGSVIIRGPKLEIESAEEE
jgi:hypothetical protein